MKNVLTLFCLAMSCTSALGEEVSRVDALSSVGLKDGFLSVSYLTPGGCSEHSAMFGVALKKSEDKSYVARVIVLDSAKTQDQCESIIAVTGEADLSNLIKEEAKRLGIDLNDLAHVELSLPKIVLDLKAESPSRPKVEDKVVEPTGT